MRVLFAPDSYKESLSALAVARAMAAGWDRADPAADLRLAPIADGGEGTTEALVAATAGRLVMVDTEDPLGRPMRAAFGVLGDGVTAVVETAAASGLALVGKQERDALRASTYGTGLLLRAALDMGYRKFILGLGGSATTDGGAGFAEALGYRFLGESGDPVPRGGIGLAAISHIDTSTRHPALSESHFTAACDVDNPLVGKRGAAFTFSPQKGATREQVRALDGGLAHFASQVEATFGRSISAMAGAGAAGGFGGGLVGIFGARLQAGFTLVAEAMCLADAIANADLVVTGEGRTDAQTLRGKAPAGVARMAKAAGVPCIIISGSLGPGYEPLYNEGTAGIFPAVSGPIHLRAAMAGAAELVEAAAFRFARYTLALKGMPIRALLDLEG